MQHAPARKARLPRPVISPDARTLADHWLFGHVAIAELTPLLVAVRTERYFPGDVIFRERDRPDGLYVIASGSVRIAVAGTRGRTILTTLETEDIFGEMGVLDGAPRSGTATAADVSTIHFVPAAPFLELLGRTSAVSIPLMQVLATQLRQMNGRLLELPAGSMPATARLARGRNAEPS
jgi:CRP/FNR family transcriptional regulator, cyclic AMP receptor protein